MAKTLTLGKRYNTGALTCIGWTGGDGSGHDGYDCWAYFADGVYLGPDEYGIEPLFDFVTSEQVGDQNEH
jgi:hypothetical protein